MHNATKLGATDFAVLDQLQAQAKVTNAQLAQEIGLSPASTLERVRKLERQGLIKGYHAKLAPEKIALHGHVLVQIKLRSLTEASVAAFRQAIAALPQIVACYQVVGGTDFWAQIFTQDLATYQDWVARKLSTIDVIQDIQSFAVTSTLKEAGLPIPKPSA